MREERGITSADQPMGRTEAPDIHKLLSPADCPSVSWASAKFLWEILEWRDFSPATVFTSHLSA